MVTGDHGPMESVLYHVKVKVNKPELVSVTTPPQQTEEHNVQDHQMRLLPVIMVPVPLMVNGDHGQVEPVLLPVVMDRRQGVTYVTILPQPMAELLVKDQTVRFWPVTVVPVLV